MDIKKIVVAIALLQPLMLLASNINPETSSLSPQILQKVGAYYKLCLPQSSSKDKESLQKQILLFTKTTPVEALQLNSAEEIHFLKDVRLGVKKIQSTSNDVGNNIATIFSYFPNVETWDVDFEEVDCHSAHRLTEKQVQGILLGCKNLKKLSVSCCWLTLSLIDWGKYKNIKTLDLSYSTLSTETLQSILDNCTQLNEFFLNGCEKIEEETNWEKQKKLQKLGLAYTYLPTKAVQQIMDNCQLTDLELGYDIKGLATEKLVWKKQTALKKLVLHPRSPVTYEYLLNLLLSCKKLTDLDLTDGMVPPELCKHYKEASEIIELELLLKKRIDLTKKLLFAIGNNIIEVKSEGAVLVDLTTCPNLPEFLRKKILVSFDLNEK